MFLSSLIGRSQHRYPAKAIVKWLWAAWRGNRLQASLNAAIGLVSVAVSLTQVWAVQRAIDIASGALHGSVYTAVGFMGGLVLAEFALGTLSVWVRNVLGIKAQNRMQQRMLDTVLRAEWKGREARHSGDVLNRLETDVNTVVGFLTETIPGTMAVLAMFLGAFYYLFSLDAALAVAITAAIPVFLLLSKVYVNRMRRLTRGVRDYDSKVQSVLQDAIQNRMLVKTLESGPAMLARLAGTQAELRRRVVQRAKFSVFSNIVVSMGFAASYLAAFLWSALRMAAGTLTFGGMTAFLQLVAKIQGPARSLAKLVPAFVSVLTAAERLMELQEDPQDRDGEPHEMDGPCGVRLTGVSYAYDKADGNVIENLSFDFKPGSRTAILGETGAGKTTMVRLLLALLKPQVGTVEIYGDGKSEVVSPQTRCNFVYVPQGNTLMSGTIRDNLKLGSPTASDKDMEEALRKSCAQFVFDLPAGLDTLCDESGGGLSEGQAQRISIARALLRNKPVMLYDEATSSLDPDTERELLGNLLSDSGKTVIFITHRHAVAEYCDGTLSFER